MNTYIILNRWFFHMYNAHTLKQNWLLSVADLLSLALSKSSFSLLCTFIGQYNSSRETTSSSYSNHCWRSVCVVLIRSWYSELQTPMECVLVGALLLCTTHLLCQELCQGMEIYSGSWYTASGEWLREGCSCAYVHTCSHKHASDITCSLHVMLQDWTSRSTDSVVHLMICTYNVHTLYNTDRISFIHLQTWVLLSKIFYFPFFSQQQQWSNDHQSVAIVTTAWQIRIDAKCI